MLVIRQKINEAKDLRLMPLGASYFCSVPWLRPPPITFASCHTPGRVLCHTEIQNGDCEEISSEPWPLRQNKANGMHSLERSVATIEQRKNSTFCSRLDRVLESVAVLCVQCPGMVGDSQPSHNLLNMESFQSTDCSKSSTHRIQNGFGNVTTTYAFQKPPFSKLVYFRLFQHYLATFFE